MEYTPDLKITKTIMNIDGSIELTIEGLEELEGGETSDNEQSAEKI